MHVNTKISEGLALLDSISPVSQTPGTVTTGWVSAAAFLSFLAVIETGVLGASATLDAKIQQATDSSGTGAKDVSGKALTQIVKASGDNKQAMIDFSAKDLDTNGGFGYVRLSLTVGTAASLIAAQLFGGNSRYELVRDLTATPPVNLGSANVVQVV